MEMRQDHHPGNNQNPQKPEGVAEPVHPEICYHEVTEIPEVKA